jgi:DNA-binding transcriptional MerR regulator
MSLTVREIADRLSGRGLEPSLVQERVRHWTREGLLELTGETHPGTGRKRLYGVNALFEAAILNELADLGIAISQMWIPLQTWRGRVKRIDPALADPAITVFLFFTRRGRGGAAAVMTVAEASDWGGVSDLMTKSDSAVFVHLSNLFRSITK